MALPFGYKTEDSRYFAYLNQNSLRGGYRDKFTSPNVFTARQKRRMRHKARKHGEDLSYPELERRWAAWKARRRERDRAIERYRAVVQGRRDRSTS